MLKITIGNNVKRSTIRVTGTTMIMEDGSQRTLANDVTVRDVLEGSGIDFTRGTTTMDGAILQPGDINKTFAALGYTDGDVRLLNVVKADNAVFAGFMAKNKSGSFIPVYKR